MIKNRTTSAHCKTVSQFTPVVYIATKPSFSQSLSVHRHLVLRRLVSSNLTTRCLAVNAILCQRIRELQTVKKQSGFLAHFVVIATD